MSLRYVIPKRSAGYLRKLVQTAKCHNVFRPNAIKSEEKVKKQNTAKFDNAMSNN